MSDLSVDELRQPWESDEHWELRKEFIEHYKEDFDEDRLLCLAQVYTNIELLSCTYPDAVMLQARHLAENLKGAAQLRDARKERAKVKFVKSNQQNESSERGKRLEPAFFSSSQGIQVKPCVLSTSKQIDSSLPQKRNLHDSSSTYSCTRKRLCTKTSIDEMKTQNCNIPASSSADVIFNAEIANSSHQQSMKWEKKLSTLKGLGKLTYQFMVKKLTPVEALHNAAQKQCVPIEYDMNLDHRTTKGSLIHRCRLIICDIVVAVVTDSNKKKCKSAAAEYATNLLRSACIEIVPDRNGNLILQEFASKKVSEEDNQLRQSDSTPQTAVIAPNQNKVSPVFTHTDNSYFSIDPSIVNNFIILDYSLIRKTENAVSILADSASYCHMTLHYDFSDLIGGEIQLCCQVFLHGFQISEATGNNKQESKQSAATAALNRLKEYVYIVQVKDVTDSIPITRKEVLDATRSGNSLPESNIGCKMLKLMGWSGGGIGKNGEKGILEPLSTDSCRKLGQGLGYCGPQEKTLISRIESLLQSYAKSDSTSDLIFTSEFTKEERKMIHSIAVKYNLKSCSRNQGEKRYITISRRFTALELLKHLLEVGGSTEKYQLLPPQNCSH